MSFINKFLKSNKIDVSIIKKTELGLIVEIRNGKGLLRECFGVNSKGEGLYTLAYDDIPLTKFHSDEYFCPTCEKLISAGYGLDKCSGKTIEALCDSLNSGFISLEQSFESLKPLLGLLPSGFYSLTDKKLIPTDGDNHFFWSITNNKTHNPATCPIYDVREWIWSHESPKFLLPTQPPSRLNMDRVKYYQRAENTRAVAYYLNGYLCALIDGHHKATEAAINKRPVNTLVISAGIVCYDMSRPKSNQRYLRFPDGIELPEKEIKNADMVLKQYHQGNQLTKEQTDKLLLLQDDSFDQYQWPEEILASANYFYNAYEYACIEWAGDLSEQRIKRIMLGLENLKDINFEHITCALFATKNPMFVDFAMYIGENEIFFDIWDKIYSMLATIKEQRVEDFFIDFLVNDDRKRPYITKIVDRYFES